MLTRKGNLICKALVFAFAVITAMTLDSCCDDCLGGSKGNKNLNPFGNENNNQNLININDNPDNNNYDYNNPDHNKPNPINGDKIEKDKNLKIAAGFKKTKDGKFWIFRTPLFYSAKEEEGKLYNVDEAVSIFGYILIEYLKLFNSNYKNIEIEYIKTLIFGDTGVGKTQIFNVGTGKNSFTDNNIPTIGVNYFSKKFNFNKNFDLQIWDTPGQEKYKTIISIFLKGASIIILVYDVTNKESFKNLDNIWYNEIKNNASELAAIGAAIFVVGNKCDLIIEEEELAGKENEVNEWINSKCE